MPREEYFCSCVINPYSLCCVLSTTVDIDLSILACRIVNLLYIFLSLYS